MGFEMNAVAPLWVYVWFAWFGFGLIGCGDGHEPGQARDSGLSAVSDGSDRLDSERGGETSDASRTADAVSPTEEDGSTTVLDGGVDSDPDTTEANSVM